MKAFVFFFTVIVFVLQAVAADSLSLTVTVTGITKQSGSVFVYLYNKDDGFPTKPEKALKKLTAKVTTQQQSFTFDNLMPGIYAVAVMHDENGNGEIDTNWIGIPKEGLGVSNNAKGFMGPPKFKDAALRITNTPVAITIPIKYRE